jgi:hypothetical protein
MIPSTTMGEVSTLVTARLVDPGDFQLRDVLGVDLLEAGKALRLVIAAVGKPVLRLAIGTQDSLIGNVLRNRSSRRAQHQRHQNQRNLRGSHCGSFRLAR